MARNINPNIRPPGGYRFIERDGSIHKASGWSSLFRIVTDYRTRCGYPVGNVPDEIMTQVCGETPAFCRDETQSPKVQSSTGMSFNNYINEWVGWALGRKRVNAWPTVSPAETARRAAICAVCPKQLSLTNSCQACIESIISGRSALLDGGKPAFQNLHPCSVLKEDCQSSVHAVLAPSNNPELPAACWRRA